MRIAITGRHTNVSDAMKQYATEKFGRLERHDDLVTTAEVIMNVEKERHIVEMIAHTKVGGREFGKAEHTDMYAAVDLLLEKMDRQLKKQKEMIKVERKHGAGAKAAAEAEAARRAAAASAKGGGAEDDGRLEDEEEV